MSRITELREAIEAALEGAADLADWRNVYAWAAPAPDWPAIVVGNGSPWIEQGDDEDTGYSVRLIRHRLLFGLGPHGEAEALAKFEAVADAIDEVLATVDVPVGMTTPSQVSIGAPGLIEYGAEGRTVLGVLVDITTVDQLNT
jgi:hypothetical protein